MATEIPPSSEFAGLTRKVIAYSERFEALVNTSKTRDLTEADWAPIEELVDTGQFVREGVFLGAEAETFGWGTYKDYISSFGKHTDWDGKLRRATETDGLVVLELEERNRRDGRTHISNTVTIYEFGAGGKLEHLDVYVSPIGMREG